MRLRRFVNLHFKKKFGKNVLEVAQSLTPESRTVYVDNDRCRAACSAQIALSAAPLSTDVARLV